MNQQEFRRSIFLEMVNLAKLNGIECMGSIQQIPTEYRPQFFDIAQQGIIKQNSLSPLKPEEWGKTDGSGLYIERNPF